MSRGRRGTALERACGYYHLRQDRSQKPVPMHRPAKKPKTPYPVFACGERADRVRGVQTQSVSLHARRAHHGASICSERFCTRSPSRVHVFARSCTHAHLLFVQKHLFSACTVLHIYILHCRCVDYNYWDRVLWCSWCTVS